MNKSELLRLVEASFKKDRKLDLVKLLDHLGIDVYLVDKSNDFNAQIVSEDGKFLILVNENHPKTRQRFSLAHELAHYVLHADYLERSGVMNRLNKTEMTFEDIQKEREADELAAEILMPTYIVADLIGEKKKAVNKSVVEEVSQTLDVSPVALIQRLRSLNYYVPYIDFS